MGMSNPQIYVNLLGTWTLLTDKDTIFNYDPYIWIKENNLHEYDFLHIGIQNTNSIRGYRIHKSQIQITNKA